MKVSLICTVYNEEFGIFDFLTSYKRQTRLATEFIILDGGSTDSTVSIIKAFAGDNPNLDIRVIVDSTCNKAFTSAPISKGRNVAISHARYDIIVTTDAGCVLSADWFEMLVEPYENSCETLVTGGKYVAISNSQFGNWYKEHFMPQPGDFDNVNFLPSSRNFSFRKRIWSEVGEYPYGTFAGEDTKFVRDIKKLGIDIVMTEASVSWQCPSTIDEAKTKHFHYAFGDGFHMQYYLKYFLSTLKLPIICFLHLFLKEYTIKLEMSKSITSGFWQGFLKRFTKC